MNKIFINIASFQDVLLSSTILSLIENASRENFLTISVFEQIDGNLNLPDNGDYYKIIYNNIMPKFTCGVMWARNEANKYVTDEDFYYQIDAHCLFDPNWDSIILNDFKESQTKYKTTKIVLSSGYKFFKIKNNCINLENIKDAYSEISFTTNDFDSEYKFLKCKAITIQPTPKENTNCYYITAGNLFTSIEFVKDITFNTNFQSYGDELYFTLEAFNRSYILLNFKNTVIYHVEFDGVENTPSFKKKIPILRNFAENSKVYTKHYVESQDYEVLKLFFDYSGIDFLTCTVTKPISI
jgi:hypothetical protein